MIPTYPIIARLAWRQFVARFDLILYGHLLFSLPLLVIGVFIKERFPLPAEAATLADFWPNLGIVFAVDYITTLLTIIVSLIIVLGIQETLQHKSTGFIQLVRAALPLYGSAIVVSLIELITTALGVSLFILPGIIASLLLSFAIVSVSWHKAGPIQAIKHSVRMVFQNFWIVGTYLILTQLLLSVILFAFAWGLPTGMAFTIFGSFVSTIIATYLVVFQTVLFTMTPGSALAKTSADKSAK